METVESKKKVEERCQQQGIECEFCTIMEICHNKNSEFEYELPLNDRTYKGRVVMRGDTITNEEGYRAVFSEQGTSASHMEAAKMLDALAHFEGCDGQNSDAMSAYTQVVLDDLAASGEDSVVET